MVQVFRDEHLGQEPRGRDTFIDDMRGNRSLDQSLAAPADPFAADVTLDFEHPRGVIEFLTHILADALELTAAVALRGLRLVTDLPVRQLRRQLPAARLGFGLRGRLSPERFDLKADGLQIRIDALIEQGALHGIELLAAPRIAPAFNEGHFVRELIDLQLLALELLVAAGKLRGTRAKLGIEFTELSVALSELSLSLGQLCDERGGQITQLLCVHLRPLAR